MLVAPGAAAAWQVPALPAVVDAPIDPGPIFRVFLKDGVALVSYGECAILDDRVVFTIVIGDGGVGTQYQLISLPLAEVDVVRTTEYRDAVRAARYAATRGDAEFAAMNAEVARALDVLVRMPDPGERVAAAEEAKRRLLAWSADHFHYRAADIRELAGLFDEVIAELRIAAGQPRLSLDLAVGAPPGPAEPLRPAPPLRQSVELALAAASATDVASEREALLRAAGTVIAGQPDIGDLAVELDRRVEVERAVEAEYARIAAALLPRAEAALARGDVRAVTRARADALRLEDAMGARRRDRHEALFGELDAILVRTQAHRLALDYYAMMRPHLLAYERAVRPVLTGLDGAGPMLDAIEDQSGPAFSTVVRVEARLARLGPALAEVEPPADLADVHATLTSALNLALDAFRRRRLAIATRELTVSGEASAAATGARLLLGQARSALVERLYPPKPR